MQDESKEQQKKKKPANLWVKILIPVLIALVVVGIYFFKNASSFADEAAPDQADAAQTTEQTEEENLPQGADDTDYRSAEFALDATDDLDIAKILSYGLPVIVDFGADSCIPCKEMAPVLEELNEELRGKAIVKFVDVWKNTDATQSMPIRVIPTQFFFDKDGKPYVPEQSTAGFIIYEHQETGEHLYTAHEGGMSKEQILSVLKELGVK